MLKNQKMPQGLRKLHGEYQSPKKKIKGKEPKKKEASKEKQKNKFRVKTKSKGKEEASKPKKSKKAKIITFNDYMNFKIKAG